MDEPPVTPPEPSELLERSTWMRALARRLVRDDARADDAVQETWLRLLRQPASSVRHLSSWLALAVRHVAAQLGRSEQRRAARERDVAIRERTSSTIDVAARAELHRRVVEAVLALDEPYKSSILLRFFDRLPPRAIAARAGVPVATVNTRLQRGMAQLRRRLAEWSNERDLRALLFPLVRVSWEIVAVSTKSKLVLAAAAAAVVVTAVGVKCLLLGSPRADAPQNGAPALAESASAVDPLPEPESGAAGRDAMSPTRIAETTPRRSVSEANRIVFRDQQRVRGRVVDEEHAAIAGARVTFSIPGADDLVPGVAHEARSELDAAGFSDVPLAPPEASATTNALGEYEVRSLRERLGYRVRVAAPGFGERTIQFPFGDGGIWFGGTGGGTRLTSRELTLLPEIVLVARTPLAVRVLDEGGDGVSGASLWYGAASGSTWRFLQRGTAAGRTDADGRVVLDLERNEALWLVARTDDGREAVLATTEGAGAASGARVDEHGAILLALRDGTPLAVTVRSSAGELLPGLRVGARYFDPADPRRSIDRLALTDDAGACRFDHLPPAPRTVFVDAPGGCMSLVATPFEEFPTVAPDIEATTVTVALAGPTFAVCFVDAATRAPAAADRLLVVQDDFCEFRDASGGQFDHAQAARGFGVVAGERTTGRIYLATPGPQSDGKFELKASRQRHSFGLIVDAPGFARTRLGPFDPEQLDRTKPLELALDHGVVVAGSVRDADGGPIEGARLAVPGAGAGTSRGQTGTTLGSVPVCSTITSADGGFRLGPLAAGSHEVVVRATGFADRRVELAFTDDRAPAPLAIVLERGLTVRGVVKLEEDDDPARFVVVGGSPSAGGTVCAGLASDGSFELGPLAPGELRLLAVALDFRDPVLPARLDGGHDRLIVEELQRRLGFEPGKPAAAPPPAVVLMLTRDVTDLALAPLRGEEDGRVELAGILDARTRDVESVEIWSEDGMTCEVKVAADGRFRARVARRGRSFVAVREHFQPDPSIWPDARLMTWYALGRFVGSEELERGAVDFSIARGSLEIQLQQPDGSPPESGAKFNLGFTGCLAGFARGNDLVQASGNINGLHLPVPVNGRLRFDDIPAGDYTLYVFLPGQQSTRGIPIKVAPDRVTSLVQTVDR